MIIPTIICDDNTNASKQLAKMLVYATDMLDENDDVDQVRLELKMFNSYETTLEYLKVQHLKAGIYFLDIELEHDNRTGIDLAEQIKDMDRDAKIVFVTNYQELAYLTFERRIGAVDYIIKSTDALKMQRRLNETLRNIVDSYNKENEKIEYITYRLGSRIINLDLRELFYIETSTASHKLNLVKSTGISFIKGNLTEFAEEYPKLLRISQSCLINPDRVEQINISDNMVVFPNGDRIRYSRKMRKYMRDWKVAK